MIVLEAYRQFLVSHLAGPRCKDDSQNVWAGSAADVAAFFNEKLAIAPLQQIDMRAITPAKTEGEAKGLAWCDDPECRALRDQYQTLVFSENGQAHQPGEREQNEWQAKARDFLAAMAAWTQSTGLTPVEHFREKIGLYNELLIIVPNGQTREFVLQSMLGYLIQNRLPPDNRLEWLLPVSQLAGRVGLDPVGWSDMIDDLRRANDSVIALSIALEGIAPRAMSAVMPLL